MRPPSRTTRHIVKARLLIVLLAAVALAGCGGGESLSPSSAKELRAQVSAVRTAASERDRKGALEALDAMADQVRGLEAGGSLAAADAAALRRGIVRAKRRVRAEIAEPAPAPTATATPEPTPTATATPEPPPPAKPGKGKDHGKEKGKKPKKGKG